MQGPLPHTFCDSCTGGPRLATGQWAEPRYLLPCGFLNFHIRYTEWDDDGFYAYWTLLDGKNECSSSLAEAGGLVGLIC